MAANCLLGIDVGTSSCKTILVDHDGAIVASETAAYPLSIPRPGWAEQDPADWITGARDALSALLAKADGVNITAIGLSGQMHGLTPLDKNHAVIRPAILWNDQRTGAECEQVSAAAGGLEGLLKLTNNPMLTGYTGGKILWLRNHEPAHFEALAQALNPKDYLRLKLTGELATEVSDASGTGLFDVASRCWSRELLDKTGIDPALLPDCHESDVVSGRVSRAGAEQFGLPEGVPVIGGGGDAVIQTLGSGVVSTGVLQTTIGTAGIAAAALDQPADNPGGRLQIFCNVAKQRWHCMGVSMNAGGAFAWLRQLLRSAASGAEISFDQLVEKAASVPPGSDGVLFLPYLMGERCPWPDPDARAAFIGLRSEHNDAHLVRSLLEGVVFALRDMVALMAATGTATPARLYASGGGASSSLWNQIQADVFDCEVVTARGAAEGGAYGAALLAGVGSGVWADVDQAAAVCTIEQRWQPDSAKAARYRQYFAIYQDLYPLLSPVFSRLSRLQD